MHIYIVYKHVKRNSSIHQHPTRLVPPNDSIDHPAKPSRNHSETEVMFTILAIRA